MNGIHEVDDPEAKKGLMDKVREMCDGPADRVPQQHQDATNSQFQQGRHFLNAEYSLRSGGTRTNSSTVGKEVCVMFLFGARSVG